MRDPPFPMRKQMKQNKTGLFQAETLSRSLGGWVSASTWRILERGTASNSYQVKVNDKLQTEQHRWKGIIKDVDRLSNHM